MGENNKYETIVFLVIMAILTIVSVGSILVTYSSLTLKQYSTFLLIFLPIEIIIYFLQKRKNNKYNIKEILLFILIGISTLSMLLSNNLRTSVFGFYNRYEGYLMFLSYYFIALSVSTLKDEYFKKIIVYFIIGIGLVNVLYGILQLDIFPYKYSFVKDSWKYSRGFQGNSMYFASLMSICYFIIIALFLHKKINYKIVLLLIVFTIGNIISGSMALLCTTILLFVLLFIHLIYLLIKDKNNKMYFFKLVVCIALFVIGSFMFSLKDSNFNRDVNTLSKEVSFAATEKKVDNSFGTGRIYIWTEVLKKAKNHLIVGVGQDNFFESFNPRLVDPVSHFRVDKSHNDYLQRLLCEGIFSLIVYLIFLGIVFFDNIKTKDTLKRIILLGFVAYSIQIFFSISVIRVTPLFFILIGLLMSNNNEIKYKPTNN